MVRTMNKKIKKRSKKFSNEFSVIQVALQWIAVSAMEQYIVLQFIAIGIAIVLYWLGELKSIAIGIGGSSSYNTIAIYCNTTKGKGSWFTSFYIIFYYSNK